MKNYEETEKELNKCAVPAVFHDMSVVNMKIYKDNIKIILILADYLDEYGIVNDENHFAVLEVTYKKVKIKEMYLSGPIDFRTLDVICLSDDKDDNVELDLLDDSYNCEFYMLFKYKNYQWKIIDVINKEEYYKYADEISQYLDNFIEMEKYKGPKWSQFSE